MIERPDLSDAAIGAALRRHYNIAVRDIEFLPIGNDSNAWAFRVQAEDDIPYFLKVRRGTINTPSLAVPHHLHAQGIEQVVAPLLSGSGQLWHRLDEFGLILYPFIEGHSVIHTGMADDHWVELGSVLKRIHTGALTPALAGQLQRETFAPKWLDFVRQWQTQGVQASQDPFGGELASFWQQKRAEIGYLLARTDALARAQLDSPPPFVLCHADIHTANLLLDAEDRLHIVDWDETVLAPKERDLMFVTGRGIGFSVGPKEESLFLRGYGETAIDAGTLAYYRYGWAIEEIGDYSARLLGLLDGGDETKRAARHFLAQVFGPGGVVELAYRSDPANQPSATGNLQHPRSFI